MIYALPISAEMVTRASIVVIAESEELNQCNLGLVKNLSMLLYQTND